MQIVIGYFEHVTTRETFVATTQLACAVNSSITAPERASIGRHRSYPSITVGKTVAVFVELERSRKIHPVKGPVGPFLHARERVAARIRSLMVQDSVVAAV